MESLKTIILSIYGRTAELSGVDEIIAIQDSEASRILPRELFTPGVGYLFFYLEKDPLEILGVNISFEEDTYSIDTVNDYVRYLKGIIIEADNLLDAYDTLAAPGQREDHYRINSVQLLKLRRPWREIISNSNYPSFRRYDKALRSADAEVFNTITTNIQSAREELQVDLEKANTPNEVGVAEKRFEETVLKQFKELMEHINKNIPESSHPIIDKYKDCVEPETISFVKSVCTAEKYLLDLYRPTNEFDFTCIGVPLWKAVELEMNESVVKFLRYKFGVIDFSAPKKNKIPQGGIISSARTVLNALDKQGSLNSIMFGGLLKVVESAKKNHLEEGLLEEKFSSGTIGFVCKPGTHSLRKQLGEIKPIRNSHSHIKPMSEKKYNELRSYILEPDIDPKESTLGKIAEIKCEMKRKYKL